MTTTLSKANKYVINDWNRHILVEYEGDPNSIKRWFEVSSAASFTPRPGTPVCLAASLEDSIVPPGGATNIVGTVDPNAWFVVEWDENQLATASGLYAANDRVPCIDLKRAKGAMLRNISVMSQVVGIGPSTYLGATLVTAGSTGKFVPLIEAELTAVSLSSATGIVPHWGFQTGGDNAAASLLYTAGSTGKFLKDQAHLKVAYYCTSVATEQYVVAEVI